MKRSSRFLKQVWNTLDRFYKGESHTTDFGKQIILERVLICCILKSREETATHIVLWTYSEKLKNAEFCSILKYCDKHRMDGFYQIENF